VLRCAPRHGVGELVGIGDAALREVAGPADPEEVGDVRLNDVTNNAAFDSKGTFTFDNLQAYMNNNASRVAQALQTASFQVQQWQSFFFAQDDFRLSSALTLNLGLRYEWSDVPLGMFGTTDPQVAAAMVPGPAQADNNNWAPRGALPTARTAATGSSATARPSSAAAGASATT
jgi:outer membrane receptor protein involved in Fe transport